ncbi:MAG: VOC family protein, partial [Gimesia sp.]|nr:VOC family protein [Gimesia sp.]
MKVHGVLETAIYVDDLQLAADFYRRLFGFEVMAEDRRFCALNAGDRSVFLIFKRGASHTAAHLEGGTIPPHDGAGPVHFAFAIDRDDLQEWEARLVAEGVDSVGRVRWPRGGASLG